jgi:hypothetical protein
MRGFAGAREQLIGPEYNLTNEDDYLLSLMICVSAIHQYDRFGRPYDLWLDTNSIGFCE